MTHETTTALCPKSKSSAEELVRTLSEKPRTMHIEWDRGIALKLVEEAVNRSYCVWSRLGSASG